MDIPYEKQFHFHDGTAIGSLDQLKTKIETVSYQEFYRHVNAEKNDFANWIRYILKDERLADDLQKVGSIVETVEILEDYLHPRSPIASHADIQSRIEETVIKTPLPADTHEEPLVVDRRPPSPPAPSPSLSSSPQHAHPELMDLRIIEERLGLRSRGEQRKEPAKTEPPKKILKDLPPAEQPKDLFADEKVREELFGPERAAQETLARETREERIDTTGIDHDATRLIVKDFIYGLVFGLVLGLVLGRVLSI